VFKQLELICSKMHSIVVVHFEMVVLPEDVSGRLNRSSDASSQSAECEDDEEEQGAEDESQEAMGTPDSWKICSEEENSERDVSDDNASEGDDNSSATDDDSCDGDLFFSISLRRTQ